MQQTWLGELIFSEAFAFWKIGVCSFLEDANHAQVYAADRKAFHQKCIQCQVRGCRFKHRPLIFIYFWFWSQWLWYTGTNWQRRAFTSTRATISVIAATNSFMTHGYKSTCFKSWVFFENHGDFKPELWTQAWLWDPWRGKTEGGERKGQKKFNQKN